VHWIIRSHFSLLLPWHASFSSRMPLIHNPSIWLDGSCSQTQPSCHKHGYITGKQQGGQWGCSVQGKISVMMVLTGKPESSFCEDQTFGHQFCFLSCSFCMEYPNCFVKWDTFSQTLHLKLLWRPIYFKLAAASRFFTPSPHLLKLFQLTGVLYVRVYVCMHVHAVVCVCACNVGPACSASCDLNCM